jgi:hypothetical protein
MCVSLSLFVSILSAPVSLYVCLCVCVSVCLHVMCATCLPVCFCECLHWGRSSLWMLECVVYVHVCVVYVYSVQDVCDGVGSFVILSFELVSFLFNF